MLLRVLSAAAVGWALLVPLAAYAASLPRGSVWHPLALGIYGLGSVICHQRVERSFHLFGAQLPVCARCTGIYVGAAVAVVMAWIVGSGFSRIATGFGRIARVGMLRLKAEPTNDVFETRVLLAFAALPSGLTLISEWTTGRVPSNAIRAATGLVFGAAVWVAILRELRPAHRLKVN
jgi:uncharacterized membrane protein